MKEKIANIVNDAIKDLNLYVDDAFIKEEEQITSLNIILDSDEVIDLDLITEASRIINPIIDELDLEELGSEFVLDICSKGVNDEQ